MKLKKKLLPILILLSLLANNALIAQVPSQVGNGSYPSPTITSGTTIDATRAAVTNIGNAGGGSSDQTLIFDGSHNYGAWGVGQKVLVILMSKSGGTMPTRNWQMTTVTGVNGSPVSSLNVTNFAYTNWITSGNTSKIQVIMVPQYYDLTIPSLGKLSCSAWDGYTGGVLAFTVYNTLTINSGGWLDVSAKGFSNMNSSGSGGVGGIAPGAPGSNVGRDGNNGLVVNFPLNPPGQGECYRDIGFSNIIPGGKGGAGGYTIAGADGTLGTNPETRLALPKSNGPKLLMMGNAGKQGKGGKGGAAGGNGGNGGNGGLTLNGGNGGSGSAGSQGGKGGNGGTGGGIIICFATTIITPSNTQCIDISGTNGGSASNGAAGGGDGGNGGNGGNAECFGGVYYGYGAGGVKGLTGKGASGGNGGDGGSIGSFSIRTTLAIDNQLSLSNIKYTVGTGGSPGSGAAPAASAVDGTDGCPDGDMSSSCAYQPLCVKRKYDVYNCAGYEAFQVLGDMDHAEDMQSYIKFTKTGSPYANSKKSTYTISTDPKYYFCVYFKCSKLLVAYEDDDIEGSAITQTQCSVNAFKELKGNVYWIKFKTTTCECDDLFKSLAETIEMHSVSTLVYGTQSEGGLSYTMGKVGFGDYIYDDYNNTIGGVGYFYNVNQPDNICVKGCNHQYSYKIEWTNLSLNTPCICSPDESGPGPGSGGPNIEIYPPDIPYIPEMWDSPEPGDDGQPGNAGDGDADAINMGDFDPNDEDGLSEIMGPPVSTGMDKVSSVGKYFAISPNPAGNQLILSVQGDPIKELIEISIYDISGKLAWRDTQVKPSNNQLNSDITQLKAGTYFVHLKTQHITETLKFVKQ